MSKLKDKYDHKNDDVTKACGFEEESFRSLFKFFMKTIMEPGSLSESVEEIEKLYNEADKDYKKEMLRFFILNSCHYFIHESRNNVEEFLKFLLDKGEGTLVVGKKGSSGEMEVVDILSNKADLSKEEIHEIINEKCTTCDKKELCKTGCDDSTKH